MRQEGFILVFALWVLAVLTVLAVSIAGGVRQKIMLVDKLDERSRMRYVLESAAEHTRAYVRRQVTDAAGNPAAGLKTNVHNNPAIFSGIFNGADQASAAYDFTDQGVTALRFGVVDEERKININTVTPLTLERLLGKVLALRAEDIKSLRDAILDWRQWGQANAVGFFSDEYYGNLQFPFKKKDADYEVLDELLLVKGMTKDYYEQLLPYVTIYGEGKVNINTATGPVLHALGLDDEVVEKILSVRRGKDAIEDTPDDHVFVRTFDISVEVQAFVKLEPAQVNAIDALNIQGYLTTNSFFYSAILNGRVAGRAWTKTARMVFSARDGRLLYWREK